MDAISVSVHNEWDPLEEIIVGTAVGARIPDSDLSLRAVAYRGTALEDIPSGPFPAVVVEETEHALKQLVNVLVGLGVRVHRPDPVDTASIVSTPDWSTSGFYHYCPRDILLAVGDMVIEAPSPMRSRSRESAAYKRIMLKCLTGGSRWIAAPPPRLTDDAFNLADPTHPGLRDTEPAFDAANVLRVGRDLLYLVSDSGNELGGRWLQSILGDAYRVHPCRDFYARMHLDSTIMFLRPGLMLLNPARLSDDHIPDFLRGWDRLWCPDLVDIGYTGAPYCSKWIGMNLLMVNPELAIVDARQHELIAAVERHKIDVIRLQLPHARTLGGGFHCVTLDVRRAGRCEDYST